ncbi:DUF3888 domain-containing protein [Solibacillus silvestris]
MKKCLSILFIFILLLSFSTVETEAINTDDVQLRDELILYLMIPTIIEALEKHYGESKQFEDPKILKIKKRDGYFDITVQVTTFEDAHNPPNDLVIITFSNYHSTSWQVIDFIRKRLK